MNLPMGIVAGGLAGVLGAAAWAALAYFANVEIGWLAWGIGGLVGFSTAAGAAMGGSGPKASGQLLGAIAVVITLLSLCLGKFAIVEIGIQQALTQITEGLDGEPMEDEMLVSFLADEIGEETHGEDWWDQYEWPLNTDGEEPSAEADYPPELWKPAAKKWGAMSAEEQAAYRDQKTAELKAGMEEFADTMVNTARQEGFLATFGVMDLLFFGLAVMTAWGMGSSTEAA